MKIQLPYATYFRVFPPILHIFVSHLPHFSGIISYILGGHLPHVLGDTSPTSHVLSGVISHIPHPYRLPQYMKLDRHMPQKVLWDVHIMSIYFITFCFQTVIENSSIFYYCFNSLMHLLYYIILAIVQCWRATGTGT